MTDAFARKLKLLGGSNECRIEGYRPRVAEINALEKELEGLSDDALRARSAELKQQHADGKPVQDMTTLTRRDEQDKHNPAVGVRARLKSASLATRPPAKGYEG
jgi:preprotein translocase subunit SecA